MAPAAANVGTMFGMLLWGLAADRFDERLVVAIGLTRCQRDIVWL